ncbi:MAG: HAD-IIIA family hydrolase [Chitinophagales bacterium]|jgi:YrbI family 3-deoxy-D-manno-octulosonate 8-phosphate phosphatase|nr:HAD-IIIA family hydrolase [Chitinophagales bacterium]
MKKNLIKAVSNLKWIFTDIDGVMTDTGVYYSDQGEMLKKFNLKDGMACERLRLFTDIKIGFITGENSQIVARRAEKLKIDKVFLGIKDKKQVLGDFLLENNIQWDEIAYIGDDMNDIEVLELAGISACPADAFSWILPKVDYICQNIGGQGCFREYVEWLLSFTNYQKK